MQEQKIAVKSRDMAALADYRAYLRAHPRLTYLFVELTDRCNLACLHCGSSCERAAGRTIDTPLLLSCLETVAADFDPQTVMICLTGGEPLLHPDFGSIAAAVQAMGFPWGITTNGTLIDAACAERLRALGLASVTVSLDGLRDDHEWLRQTPGCFDRTLDGIRHLQAAGIPVQVTTVIHHRNLDKLDDIYELMCRLRIASWRVINMEPIGRALDRQNLLLSRAEFLRLLRFIRDRRYAADTPMDVRFGCSHYLSFEWEREVRDNYFLCGSGILVGSILCNGDIYSCLDIERRPELVQGNIAHDRFSEVWRNRFHAFREDRSRQNPRCRDCPEERFCGGDAGHTWDFDRREPLFCYLHPPEDDEKSEIRYSDKGSPV